MKYIYQARTKEGAVETGTVEASSREAAAVLLQKYNVYVTSLKEETPQFLSLLKNWRFEKINKKDLAIFSRQLAVMLQSRVGVVQSLRSLASQIKKQGFREKVMAISQMVEEGGSLSEGFATYPKVFNVFYVSLIKTGEASGKISESLYYLSDHLEREHDISSQIKGAMIYPIFVISVLLIVMIIVALFVMPRLVDLLKETTNNPPPFTVFMIAFYGFLFRFGWIVIVAFFALVVFIIYYFTTKEGKKIFDKICLKAPLIGSFFKKIFLVRFAESISTLVSAGLSINKALGITKDTVENFVYREILAEVESKVSEGEKISSVLMRYPEYAPPFVVQMIQVGEDTGKLDRNLMEIVNFYQKEIKRAVETFTTLLEPILIVFLGGAVALLAISVLQPLYGALGTI